jgi:hypothetical protein
METPLHPMVHGYNRDLATKEQQLAHLPWYETMIPVLKRSKMHKKQHQLSDFGRSDKLLWLEIEKKSPGGSLYYEETIQHLSHQEEGGNGTKRHAVR